MEQYIEWYRLEIEKKLNNYFLINSKEISYIYAKIIERKVLLFCDENNVSCNIKNDTAIDILGIISQNIMMTLENREQILIYLDKNDIKMENLFDNKILQCEKILKETNIKHKTTNEYYCKKCKKNDFKVIFVQTRCADEPPTCVYKCIHCN